MIIEYILIMVLLLGLATVAAREFRNNQFVANLVSGPWLRLSGMIQNGVWLPQETSNRLHPNQHRRHGTATGDRVQ
jgi:hypothetical protein